MRFAIVVGSIFAVAASSTVAVPFYGTQARGYDTNPILARDYDLVLRDVLQAVHARELAHLEARTREVTAVWRRRERPTANVAPAEPAEPARIPLVAPRPPPRERLPALTDQERARDAQHTNDVVEGRTANPGGVQNTQVTPTTHISGQGPRRAPYNPFTSR
ncbi:hypothetical protein EIP91_001749 [Steccherinum ochraceum]|uniref:Uncharacterized protein n=1 Tax=Steccherinum ochraceum TaxID=92696 RepID=A0A4V2MWH6_9APHY|nr:hypothetical protein EIP91_001749 [Steccherinum ochraceum]